MYVGLAVAVTWIFQVMTGQWRRPVDLFDRLGRVVGLAWILIGAAWALREYLGLI